MHGSWNRANPTGAKVVRIPYTNGRAEPYYEDFMTGFTVADHEVLGRPVGVTVGHRRLALRVGGREQRHLLRELGARLLSPCHVGGGCPAPAQA